MMGSKYDLNGIQENIVSFGKPILYVGP